MIAMPAQLLLEARTRAGLTQKALAARAGTSQSVVARIENGQNTPGFETLQKLLKAAGYSLAVDLAPVQPGDPLVDSYKSGIDRSQLRENLRRSFEGRVRALQQLVALSVEARAAGRKLRSKA
jgi:transcriptional regulator with XRE-family HTH domain